MNKYQDNFSRRKMLKISSAAAIYSCFIRGVREHAQAEDKPTALQRAKRNTIFIFTPFGFRPDEIPGIYREGKLTFDGCLSPFMPASAEIKSCISAVKGIRYEYKGVGDPHQQGVGKFLTGQALAQGSFARMDDGNANVGFGGGISLDRLLAKQAGPGSLLPVFYAGCFERFELHPAFTVSMHESNKPATPFVNSKEAFEKVFSDFALDVVERKKKLNLRMQTLSMLQSKLKNLSNAHGQAVKKQFEEDLAGIESLQKSYAENLDSQCQAPILEGNRNLGDFEQEANAYVKTLVQALSCNLTRVGVISFWGCTGGPQVPTLSGNSQSTHGISHDSTSAGYQASMKLAQFYARFLLLLMTELQSKRDLSGKPLLDTTTILWGSDSTWHPAPGTTLADNNFSGHNMDGMQFILAGGRDFINHGRVYDYKNTRHNNDLLLTVAKASGLDLESFGDPSQVKGVLSEILK